MSERFLVKVGDEIVATTHDRCKDFDEDCEWIGCKLACWLHDPTTGECPYLTGEIYDPTA